jgi:hypothetical protein
MKRLVDDVTIDHSQARLLELVCGARRCQPDSFRRRRILLRLEKNRFGTRSRLRPLVLGLAAVLVAASAAGSGAAWWTVGREQTRWSARKASGASESAPSASAVPMPPMLDQAEQNLLDDNQNMPTQAPDRSTDQAPANREDPALVYQAIRALRNEHNPAVAESLLRAYLRSNPRGLLAEDAFALLIETAAARHDPGVVERASRYLRLYPNGRYRAAAKRVLAPRP